MARTLCSQLRDRMREHMDGDQLRDRMYEHLDVRTLGQLRIPLCSQLQGQLHSILKEDFDVWNNTYAAAWSAT